MVTTETRTPPPGASVVAHWVAGYIVFVLALVAAGFTSRDPDSNLYAAISAQLAGLPFRDWIAPQWAGQWGLHGLYREHPVGLFILPAIVVKLGFPALEAAYAVNGLYQIASLVLIQRLAARFVGDARATTIACAIQVMPLAFTYRVRANQEAAVLMGLAFVISCLERRSGGWSVLGAAAGAAWVALVKGVFVVFVPFAAILWFWLRSQEDGWRTTPRRLAVLATIVVPVAVGIVYEWMYASRTGESFVRVYLGTQLGIAAQQKSTLLVPLKLYNAFWYVARIAWFSCPWSLVVAWALVTRGREVRGLFQRALFRRQRPPLGAGEQALLFCLLLCGAYVVGFSLSDRKAERYIFPAYYLVSIAGTAILLNTSGWFRRLATSAGLTRPSSPAVLWTVATLGTIALGRTLPRIKVWSS